MQIYIFISHSFHDEHHLTNVSEFRDVIISVCEQIKLEVTQRYEIDIEFKTYFEDAQYGKLLQAGLRKQIENSDIFIMDMVDASPNLFYELGYAHALKKEIIILAGLKAPSLIPTDMSDLLVGKYSDLSDLQLKLKSRLSERVNKVIVAFKRSTQAPRQRCFWFDNQVKELHVICAPEPERTRFAALNSSDYLYIDNLDDRDALFEVSTFLARAYPNAKILRHASDNLSPDIFDGNIVVLGGPNNNSLTRDLMHALDVCIEYVQNDKNDNAIQFTSLSGQKTLIQAQKNSEGLLLTDVGYFGRFLNPFNRNNRVIMCHGCHTFGTLAACLLCADNNQALDNKKYLYGVRNVDPFELDRIECAFEVTIMESRRIVHPTVQSDLLILS
jgi:nucleoside 2-deoxyribosyltransferase